ncbi:DUF2142 domain-containing protein [Kitasatospora xanthocidica]|uniref:DUF2142 domain-containing protein n=2 Tax=Kitasatospora xanthocidica TaxID=83382 RepID=A0A372ZXM2_9ACTN|nr:DUF2142 domain-containing protein [Kitasatospora xanthocidica]
MVPHAEFGPTPKAHFQMMITAVKSIAERLATSPRRLWAVAFAILFALSASWSLATPIGGSPDEPAHLIRAGAVARGQVNGEEVMTPHTVGGIKSYWAESGVVLPRIYEDVAETHSCYAFKPWQSADCAPALKQRSGTAEVTTSAGRYHPAYYFAVGWPSLLLPGKTAFYLMRLISAAICAALVASAVVSAAEWRRRSLGILGVVAAATPMSLFMFGVVNPSGPEIAAGILVWSAAVALLMNPDPQLLSRRVARLGIGATVLISIRPLGVIWCSGAVFFALLLLGRRDVLGSILRHRATWVWGALTAVSAGVALVWSSTHPDHSVINAPSGFTPLSAARQTFDNGLLYMKQMIGYFGWLDAEPPAVTLLLWCGVAVLLSLLALCYARLRDSLAVLGILAGIVVIPLVAQAMQAQKVGMIWQGRYLLPFAVGLPIVCAAICHERLPQGGFAWRRLMVLCSAVLALADFAAFVWALRRMAVGTGGSFFISPAHWAPPFVGWQPCVLLYGVAVAALGLLVALSDRKETDQQQGEVSSAGTSGDGADDGSAPLAAVRAEA